MTDRRVTVLILHGVNIWNTGDLGLLEVTVQRLRQEFGTGVRIISENAFAHTDATLRSHLERLGIESVPPLAPVRQHARRGVLAWLAHLALAGAAAVAVRLLGTRALAALPRNIAQPIRAIAEADIVISKAGGHLYATPDRKIGSASYLFTIWAATLLRPTVIYAQSVGPFTNGLADRVARFALSGAALATAREPRSLAWLRGVMPADRVHLTADEAFELPVATQSIDRDRELGITAVTWRFPGHPRPEAARSAYRESLVEVARWYIDKRDGHVSFVRWLGGGHREDDGALIDELVDRVDRPGHIQAIGPFPPVEASRRLGQMDMFIGSRLHSAIFAMVAGTPALAIEYLPKTSEIMAMVSATPRSIAIDAVDRGRLLAEAVRLHADRDQVREELAGRIPELREAAAQNARLVRKLAEGKRQAS